MISSLPVIAGAARFFIASLTVHDLILLLVQIEQGVQLVQAGGFRCKLFLLGEWLLYLGLCIFKLMQTLQDALKQYVKRKGTDLRKLMRYAQMFRVEKLLRQYLEVLL